MSDYRQNLADYKAEKRSPAPSAGVKKKAKKRKVERPFLLQVKYSLFRENEWSRWGEYRTLDIALGVMRTKQATWSSMRILDTKAQIFYYLNLETGEVTEERLDPID